MVSVFGFMATVNPPAVPAVTVSWNVAVLSAWPAAVPFTVTVALPVAALAAAVSVRVDELPAALSGSNAAVTPVGRPSAVSETAPAKPPVLVMLTVCVAAPPCVAATVALATAHVYVGAATTVIARGAVSALTPVPAAFTVALMTPGVADSPTSNVMMADDALPSIVAGADA